MTVMKTSKQARQLPLKSQQALCEFIRKQIAPDIDYPEWLKIEKDISEVKQNLNRFMMEGIMNSVGEEVEIPTEAEAIFKNDLRELDENVRDEMKNIDIKKILNAIDNEKIALNEMKKLNKIFDMVLKEKGMNEDKD